MDPSVNAVVSVGFLAAIIAYILERVRARMPGLDGDLLVAVSVLVGVGLAFLLDLDIAADLGLEGLVAPLGTIATGLAIASVTGLFGTAKNALRARDPKSSISERGLTCNR